jgi:probable addiction module antidote protein
MKHEITDFDPAEYLDNDEMIAGYLSDALETQNPAFIADAIGVVARAKGMKRVAEDAGVSRESLYRALNANANPEFGTVLKVLAWLNINLVAQPDGVGSHHPAAQRDPFLCWGFQMLRTSLFLDIKQVIHIYLQYSCQFLEGGR